MAPQQEHRILNSLKFNNIITTTIGGLLIVIIVGLWNLGSSVVRNADKVPEVIQAVADDHKLISEHYQEFVELKGKVLPVKNQSNDNITSK